MAHLILPSRFTQQPQHRVEVNRDVFPGRSQIILPSLGYSGVIGGTETFTLANANAPFTQVSNVGRVHAYRPNSSTLSGESYTWEAGNFDVGSDASMVGLLAFVESGFNGSFGYGGSNWGLWLGLYSTGARAAYVDSPTSSAYTTTLSLTNTIKTFLPIGLVKRGNTLKLFFKGQSASVTGGNGGIRRSAGSGLFDAIGVEGWTGYGAMALAGICSVPLADQAMFSLLENPWQIFRKRPQILYFDVGGGGATDLTIADATHGHSADNAVLTSSHLLTVADATHAHSADNVALSTAILLALADALHGHTADNLTLTLAGSEDLVIADASHAHTADSLSLTTLSVLVVAEALHSHLADNVVLSLAGAENLVIADAAHAHSADNLSLTSQLALSIAEATHAHTADGIVITSQHVLAVADALHAHMADNLTLSDAPSLTIAEASHGHTADNLALTSDSLLAIADAAHAHLADEIELTSAHTLAIVEAMHAHYADNVVLNFADLLGKVSRILSASYNPRIKSVTYNPRIKPRELS